MDLLNRVMIAGNLTRDPEVRETGNGKAVTNLALAIDPPGSHKRTEAPNAETIFVDVVLWERNAENAADYLRKGSAVLIEGRLRMDCWEDRETRQVRRKLKIAGERMKFLNLGGGRDREPRKESEGGRRSDGGHERGGPRSRAKEASGRSGR